MSKKIKVSLKTFGYIILSLIVLGCLGVCVWYMWILNYVPGKLVSNTVYAGFQETADGTVKAPFTVKYNSNKNKNGHEVLSICFNYLRDEKAETLVSQGVQYETRDVNESLDFFTWDDFTKSSLDVLLKHNVKLGTSYVEHTARKGLWKGEYSSIYFSPFLNTGIKNSYAFVNGNLAMGSTQPIDENTFFTFQTVQGSTEDMIYMQFRGDHYAKYNSKAKQVEADVDELSKDINHGTFKTYYNYYYDYFNMDWFASRIYEKIQSVAPGTHATLILPFGNNFNYWKVDPDGSVGEEIMYTNSTKVQSMVKSYFVFDIEVTADGAQSSKDTLFGILHDSANYKVDGYTGENGEYFAGDNIIDVTYKAFDFVKLSNTDVALKLKKDFLSAYLPYKKNIKLNVCIDTEEIKLLGYNFVGFTSDSGLDNFQIYKSGVI